MRLFRKKDTPEPSDIVNEKWHSSFSIFQEHRFAAESGDGYSSAIEHGRLRLEISRKNLFAWVDDPLYRYDNFLLEAELGIDPANGHSSSGFLFRRIEDLSYYYFLVSNKGHFRCDLVLNNTPSPLVDWAPCPDFDPERFSIAISADGGRLSFYLNGSWLGGISDESLEAGGLAFAAQNYDQTEKALFSLYNIGIESRPSELETRRGKKLPHTVPPPARLAFAESRMRSGHYSGALIEIKQVLKHDPGDPSVLMMAAECCINLELYDDALNYLENVPESHHDEHYLLRKAGALYLGNNILALREMLSERPDFVETNPIAANLLGNAEFSLGNWEQAAGGYLSAFGIEAAGLYAFNAARALEKLGRVDEAAGMYGKAAGEYFREGRYDELEGILPYLEALDSSNVETKILRAKLYFQDGRLEESYPLFLEAAGAGTEDSTVFYLSALIEAKNEEAGKAEQSFARAIDLEPDYYLYHFKYAEHLFLKGDDCSESLRRALELAPEDPWVLNLAGLEAMESERFNDAVGFFESAAAAAPEEDEIKVNLSEAHYLAGSPDTALRLLEGNSADLLNQRGNIFARLSRFPEALREYEAAAAASRNRVDIMLNLAAACIENDSFIRAEELLVRVMESGEHAQAYNLIGNLAMLKGEAGRAEAAYRRAVDLEPDFTDAVCNLAEFYIARERLNDADLVLAGLRLENPGARYEQLKDAVFKRRMSVHKCRSCGREWTVPKVIESQPVLKLVGEPPDEMPAGKCGECGDVYCIGCAKEHLSEGRLSCASCGAPLKLSEDWMRYLYHKQGF